MQSNPCLSASALTTQFENISQISGQTLVLPEVIAAVDNIRTRLNIQAAIPKVLWNVWTDTSEGTLRYGIGHHTLDGDYECLACSYFPEDENPSQMKLYSIRTGLSEDEIRSKLAKNAICTQQDIEHISKSTGADLNFLKPNIGKSFQNLLHGECGLFRIPSHENHALTPAPHVPVLAGVLLASQLILSRIELPESATLVESVSDFNSLVIPISNVNKLHSQSNADMALAI